MTAIWKFPLPIDDEVQIQMPRGAIVLTVAVQRGQACLWAVVDTMQTVEPRRFAVRGTGHPVAATPDALGWSYIGSIQLMDGELVFHVFEVKTVGGE
jgi:hypothetical protein